MNLHVVMIVTHLSPRMDAVHLLVLPIDSVRGSELFLLLIIVWEWWALGNYIP